MEVNINDTLVATVFDHETLQFDRKLGSASMSLKTLKMGDGRPRDFKISAGSGSVSFRVVFKLYQSGSNQKMMTTQLAQSK